MSEITTNKLYYPRQFKHVKRGVTSEDVFHWRRSKFKCYGKNRSSELAILFKGDCLYILLFCLSAEHFRQLCLRLFYKVWTWELKRCTQCWVLKHCVDLGYTRQLGMHNIRSVDLAGTKDVTQCRILKYQCGLTQ